MTKHRETTLAAERNGGDVPSRVLLQQRETEADAPVIPVDAMERLHAFRPDLVDWIVRQTEAETEHRRSLERETCARFHAERRLGQWLGFAIGLLGVAGGGYVATHGAPGTGSVIASVAIGTLALGFLRRG